MTVRQITSIERYIGLSSDTKPTSVNNGTTFFETDTGVLYITGDAGSTWSEYEAATRRIRGIGQCFVKSVTSAANAGDVTLATVTTQPCVITAVQIHADAAQTSDMTSCGVFGGSSKAVTFIAAANAVQAELDATSKQLGWTGGVRLNTSDTIVTTLAGTGATAVDLTFTISFHAEVDGGYLA